jgi:GT2 family glycosyltransferase
LSNCRVSVVVPVYNGERHIADCLDSLLAQDASFSYEVIVVDSSTDRTPEIVATEYPWVRLVRLAERAFPGTARNHGIRLSTAPFIAMIDADCIAEPDLLSRMTNAHESGDFGGVGGAICNGTGYNLSGFIGYVLEFREFIPTSPRRVVVTIPTANICYRREVFERCGLFDDIRAGEDLLFNWRITLAGEKLLFDPEIRVTHNNRTGWLDVFKYQRVLGYGSAAARCRAEPPFSVMQAYPALGWLMPYLIKYPLLSFLIPPVRLARALLWLGRHDRGAFLLVAGLSPYYLICAGNWAWAFVDGLRNGLERQVD